MLHVIKKIQQQKKNRQEIFYCVKWLSDFLQRSDLTFWLLFLLLYSILFFRFTPWRPLTHNGVQSFLKSHLKLLYSYDFTNYFSKLSKDPLILLRLTIVAYCQCKSSHTSRWKFFGRNLMKLFNISNFKCDFKIGLTPMLTLSQLLFTFQQLSSRFLQNLFYLFFSSQFAGMRARPIGLYGDRGALSPIYLIYNNPIPIREGRLSPH